MIIAIDGPSGSGKSTIARTIAERINIAYLDTGAMYRAVALVALRKKVELDDGDKLTRIAAETIMQLLDERVDGKLSPRVVIAGVDETAELRTPEVSQGASMVAIHPGVRERLVSRQRNWVENHKGAVVEGRDIGTVVFPDADLKVFLTASESERNKRRMNDANAPEFASLGADEVKAELAQRDQRDSSRSTSPTAAAPDALIIDSSGREIDDVATEILTELRKRSGGKLPMDGEF